MLSPRFRAHAIAFASAVALFPDLATPVVAVAQSREVTAYVSALDSRGVPLDSLTPADVTVREDGLAREVLQVSPATDPIQLMLLVDNSAATRDQIADFRRALPGFVEAMADRAEITLMTFGDRPTVAAGPATSAIPIKRSLERLFPLSSAGGYVMDAIVEASRSLEKRGATRPLIVVVATDGVEFSNLHGDRVIDALVASGAALHVVIVNSNPGAALATEEGRQRAIVYDRGVSVSGGQRIDLLTSLSLEKTLKTLADELTKQYKVVYSRPVSLIPPERVAISAGRPSITVRGARAPLPRTK